MRAMIIPGNENADMSQAWYPYVKKELERLGIKVIAKNMPDADLARKEYWLPFIEQQLEEDADSILIGHSSGAVAAMRYLENHKAVGAVLVSAEYTDLNNEKEKIRGYYDETWRWNKIKKNAKWIIQFHSTDDPFIPAEEARFIHQQLSTEYHEFSNQSHFWAIGNLIKDKFPEIIEAIRKKLNK